MSKASRSRSDEESFELLVNPSEETILPVLEMDPIWASYGFCDLEPEFRPKCDWYVTARNDEPSAGALVFKELPAWDLYFFGEPEGVAFLGECISLPDTVYAHIHPSHREIVEPLYAWENLRSFLRMSLTEAMFSPRSLKAERLGPENLPEVQAFYDQHPGNFFTPEMLEAGPYFAVRRAGDILSIAGIHVMSRTWHLGNLGNVYTDREHRRSGYAAACVSSVVEELFSTGCRRVFLNVESDNVAASRLYEDLGFKTHCIYSEGIGALRKT